MGDDELRRLADEVAVEKRAQLEGATAALKPLSFIADLQLLRAVAILLVLIAHLSLPTMISDSLGITNPGWIGVELFFVISGFVVMRSLQKSGWEIVPFAIRRFFRLYPLLVVFAASTFLLVLYARNNTPEYARKFFVVPIDQFGRQIADIFLCRFPTAENGTSYTNGPIWSLTREFRFYAYLAVLVAALLPVIQARPRLLNTTLLAIAAATAAIGFVVGRVWHGIAGSTPEPISWLLDWFLDIMALGVFAALLSDHVRRRLAVLTSPFVWLFLLAPLVLLCLMPEPHATLRSTVPLIGICSLCFFVVVIAAAETGLAASIPRSIRHAGDFVGDRSYARYVFHFPIFMLVWYLWAGFIEHHIPGTLSGKWTWPICQAILFCLIAPPFIDILYKNVELPWDRLRQGSYRLPDSPCSQKPIRGVRTIPPSIIVASSLSKSRQASIDVGQQQINARVTRW